MKIQCIDREVRQILESGIYIVPRFQRPFSWDRNNIEEFWNDATSDVKKDYFIGAFVTYNISSSVYGVVDGQQRLTTITIALCAIRDKYQELGHIAAARGVHRLIETRDLDNHALFVLGTETSYPYLQAKIQSFAKDEEEMEVREEEVALADAYNTLCWYIDSGIAEVSESDPAKSKRATKKWLDQVRDKFLSLKVISITLDNQEDAYTIFETLNTRGKDLTAADLAKNHFLRLLPTKSKSIDLPKDNWQEMQRTLESAARSIQFKTFLHHYWLSKHPFVTEKQLFRSIRNEVTTSNVKDVLSELKIDSKLYRGITEPDFLDLWGKHTLDVKDSLLCITNILNIQIANPLLLAILRLYNAKRLKDGQVRELFGLVERYHYLFTTISALPSSGGVSQMYAAHARDLSNANDSNALGVSIQDFKKKIKERIPSKDVFVSKFKQLTYANARQREVLRYTLWRIAKAKNPALDLERTSGTIEHLAPQASSAPHIHQIGNLLLVPGKFNGEILGAKVFSEKRKLLKAGGYPLEPEIIASANWGEDEIVNRTAALADFAYNQVWSIK
ncbi:DUF262 domain-containing protein [Paraburkholderia sp. JPY432]|uniref:DUF262 domain-containing protein n=1 Tax=Paraburkholderia youngii TaxID=2782701 RepID=UPI00159590D0|nr:DUF262 domain-containing protein [Paraburkholderia youngii]NVH73721.1 DUF262 domain-containing protein [Paraburkholderia youngii]